LFFDEKRSEAVIAGGRWNEPEIGDFFSGFVIWKVYLSWNGLFYLKRANFFIEELSHIKGIFC